MPNFICDNKKTEDLLRKLYDIIKAEGAYIHEDLGIVCDNGQFSIINSGEIRPNQKVISMPESCAVRGEEFNLTFKNDQISILSHSNLVSDLEIQIMNLALEIYNINSKLAHHRRSSILTLFYNDPGAFKILAGYCKWNLFQDLSIKNEQDCLGRNFMKFRYMEKGRNAGLSAGTRVLLPFIEYFNHHPMASIVNEYAGKSEEEAGFEVYASFPLVSNNLFIRYGFFDCYDLFALENYVDSSTFFVRSRPMSIEIENLCMLEIDIQLRSPVHQALPPEIADLGPYMPYAKIDRDQKEVYLGYSLIPSNQAPQALRRVLKFVFEQIAETQEQAMQAVLYAERQIISRNIAYYRALTEYLMAYKSSPATDDIMRNAQKMAHVQILKMENYSELMELVN